MRFYHIELSKVRDWNSYKITIQPIQHGGYEILRQKIIDHVLDHVTYSPTTPEMNYTILLNKKGYRPMLCFYIDLAYRWVSETLS